MSQPRPNFSEISSLHSRAPENAPQSIHEPEPVIGNFDRIVQELDKVQDPSQISKHENSKEGSGDKDGAKDPTDDHGWDASVEMDLKDARRLVASNYIINQMEARKIDAMKPGHEDKKAYVDILQSSKSVLHILIVIFILLGRPDWCKAYKNSITYTCNELLDPSKHVHFIKSWIPVLSSGTKFLVCAISMIIIDIADSCKVGFTVSNDLERNSTVITIILAVFYLIFGTLKEWDLYWLTGLDLFPVFFLLISSRRLRKSMLQFIEIMTRGKFVFLFIGVFIVITSSICFLLWSNYDEFTDSVESGYSTYNFNSFTGAFYSITMTTLYFANSAKIMNFFIANSVTYLAMFMLIAFFIKFFIQSYIVGTLYFFYSRFFKENFIELMNKHPKLAEDLTEMVEEGKISETHLNNLLDDYLTPEDQKDKIVHLNRFYEKASKKILESEISKNPDCGLRKFNNIFKHNVFDYVMSGVEFLVIICLIITLDGSSPLSYSVYIYFFVLNFFYIFIQLCRIEINGISTKSALYAFDIFSCLIVNMIIIMALIGGSVVSFHEIMEQNFVMKKTIGLLMLIKIFQVYKLLLKFTQIQLTIGMFVKSIWFLLDQFSMMLIVMFIYSNIGVVLFGGNVTDNTLLDIKKIYGEDLDPSLLLMNFNDMYYAFLTLFITVFGGFTNILRINTAATGHTGIIPLFFFLSYYILLASSLMNILLGFLMDNVAEYFKENRMDSNKERVLEKHDKGKSGNGDDGYSNGPDDSDNKKSLNENSVSRLSEDLDVYLNLKKKKEKKKNNVSKPLIEIHEEALEDEKVHDPQQSNNVLVEENEIPLEKNQDRMEEGQNFPEQNLSEQNLPEQVPIKSSSIKSIQEKPIETKEEEESVFIGTPVDKIGSEKYNPLTKIVKK